MFCLIELGVWEQLNLSIHKVASNLLPKLADEGVCQIKVQIKVRKSRCHLLLKTMKYALNRYSPSNQNKRIERIKIRIGSPNPLIQGSIKAL